MALIMLHFSFIEGWVFFSFGKKRNDTFVILTVLFYYEYLKEEKQAI